MRTVKEVSNLTGISVRTLHHYDAIDLLKPAKVTKAGYRLYDDTAMERLQMILLFRELQFPLKEIKEILDNPDFHPEEAISQQIRLLELQYKRMGELLLMAREIQKKGVNIMNFDVFSKKEIEAYKAEAKEKWGNTEAYQEYEHRRAGKKDDSEKTTGMNFMQLFAEIGAMKEAAPEDDKVQEKIADIQEFITEHFYTCTKEILKGLGGMYVADERFRKNIDKAGGTGTAEFVKRAIDIYCR